MADAGLEGCQEEPIAGDHVAADRLRVLWLTPAFPWAGQPVDGYFYRTQAAALARQGVGITVSAAVPHAPWPLSRLRPRWRAYRDAPPDAIDAGVRVIRPRYPNVPGQPRWARADRFVAAAAWRARNVWRGADLVHGHSAIEALAARRLAARASLPFVITFHGGDINTWPRQRPDRRDDLVAAIRDAALVIAVSEALAARIGELAGVEALALPLGTDHRDIAAQQLDRASARRALGIPHDRVVALFVGHLLEAKGALVFADAVLAVGKPFLGILVGGGPMAGYAADRSSAADMLRYTGELPHDQVVRYMSAADVLVLPSYSEGLPTVVVEAGSLGLPVIATAVGGVPELLAEGRGLLLASPEPADLASMLRAFASNPEGAAAMAGRLRAHVRAVFDVDTNAARLIERYRSAIVRPDSGSHR
ncbi:MAG TPA: glycosyltransferase family 4 protein [Candidatus Limnocylindrales bacterium]